MPEAITPPTVGDRVFKILMGPPFYNLEDLTRESLLNKDLGLDSLDMIELLMLLEDEFRHSIPDTDGRKWKTVGDIITYLEVEPDWGAAV